jgi:CheY-like chemotaxis protein
MRVLIVEPHPDTAAATRDLVESWGHTAEVAAGSTVREAARRFRPEVVLCEAVLPGQDGITLCADLRGDPALSGTHFIVTSGFAPASLWERAAATGFDRCLVKPLDPDLLQRMLDELASLRRH